MNTSNRVIRSPRFCINGKPPDRIESLIRTDDNPTQRQKALRLYRHWTDNIVHYPVGIKACRHPFLLNNYWGYNICGFAAAFLSSILQKLGIPAQKVPVQGHVVHQYRINERWIILDADLNCVYRMLDNRRFAGFDDIRKDPLLVHRTNTYGRHRSFDLERNRFSASLYEFHPTEMKKPPAYDSDVFSGLPKPMSLYPGESITYDFERTIRRPLKESSAPLPKEVGEVSLMQVRYRFRPDRRPADRRGEKVLFTRYSIRSIRFVDTNRTIDVPDDQIVTHVSLPADVAEEIECICQCSRVTAPRILRGLNTIRLDSPDKDVEAELTIDLNPEVSSMKPPTPPELSVKDQYRDEPVCFEWNSGNAQSIWIHVLGEDEQPLLDYVRKAEVSIGFHPLEQTFFDNGGIYRVRAQQEIDGTWSGWSEEVTFRVAKPSTPHDIKIELNREGDILASWRGGEDCEFLVFGSDRLDFIPDIYTDEQPVDGLDGKLEMKSVSNLLCRTNARTCRIPKPCVFYRLIALRNGVYSNPSVMIDLSRDTGWNDLEPKVLQTYHRMVDGKNRYETVIDRLLR